MKITLNINNRDYETEVKPGEYLTDTLRRLHQVSVRRGCDTSSCGVCTVLIEGKPVPSCAFLSYRAEGKRITTVEGIPDEASELSRYFGGEGADQCGFCNPGIALSVYALKQAQGPYTEANIRHVLTGHLCRCSGYHAQVEAVKRYLEANHE